MISIIIPLKKDQGYLKPCVDACFRNAGAEIEVIVLPDGDAGYEDPRVRIEPTGVVSPAKKRNRGAEFARGDILAFIDDDTRPLPGWIQAALKQFEDPSVSAVGGPSITPPDDPFLAQVSGVVYESWMMSGTEIYRYLPRSARDVDDFPSCNLLVRKAVFLEVGGFGTDFWPGEDTEFCLKLVQKGHLIRYEPRAVIEHHRRPSLYRHWVQLGSYALHRGYFVKRYPETSLRFLYFLPTASVILGSVLLVQSLRGNVSAQMALVFFSATYLLLILLSLMGLGKKKIGVKGMGIPILFVSHLVYGILFMYGLMVSQLPEEKRKAG